MTRYDLITMQQGTRPDVVVPVEGYDDFAEIATAQVNLGYRIRYERGRGHLPIYAVDFPTLLYVYESAVETGRVVFEPTADNGGY